MLNIEDAGCSLFKISLTAIAYHTIADIDMTIPEIDATDVVQYVRGVVVVDVTFSVFVDCLGPWEFL